MPFEIVRSDIVNMRVDAIVNTANPRPVIGAGVDAGIHRKAGPRLLEARQAIGDIRVGDAAVTPGFELEAKFVIHTVGPVWRGGGFGEEALLRRCYDSALALALAQGCESVAFPLICAGNYGFPRDRALGIALNAFREFLMAHEMEIFLVVFDRESFRLSERLQRGISSFIDEHYVEEANRRQREYPGVLRNRRRAEYVCMEAAPMAARKPAVPEKASLPELLENTDAGFSETLLKLIAATGKKDSEIYTKANVSRQHFSKIRSNPDYRPTKATALAFAIALELDLEQTADLIGRAGYALTNSSKFDVIIMYFIRERNYNLFDINATLFDFDQSCLGA